MIGAPNFSLAEFAAASDVPLTPMMQAHAQWHAIELQRVRDALNDFYGVPAVGGEWRIHLTSFVRSKATGDHSTGVGLDWNVRDKSGTRYDNLTRWARDWLALNRPDAFAELIYEPGFSEGAYAHVHHARRGFSKDASANQQPQILDETSEGVYTVASILPFPKPVSLSLLFLFGAGLAYYLTTTRSL